MRAHEGGNLFTGVAALYGEQAYIMVSVIFGQIRQVPSCKQGLEIVVEKIELGKRGLRRGTDHKIYDLERAGVGENTGAARRGLDGLAIDTHYSDPQVDPSRRSSRRNFIGDGIRALCSIYGTLAEHLFC